MLCLGQAEFGWQSVRFGSVWVIRQSAVRRGKLRLGKKRYGAARIISIGKLRLSSAWYVEARSGI